MALTKYLSETPLARAEALAPMIAARVDDIDRDRRLPDDVVEAFKERGMFRLLTPRSLGGEELDWPLYLDVVRTIAAADGSAGWCFNQGTVFATTAGRAPRSLAEEVWGDPGTVVANGPPEGGATAVPTRGGYKLSGNWMFSSGSRHANWIAAVSAGSGQPVRLHFLPKSEVNFVDVWQVQGLRGTGSFGFHVEDHFVPESRTMPTEVPPVEPGPLYLIPQDLLFACGFGCVALGVSRAGVDATIELASEKRPRFSRRPLAEDPLVRNQIGKAEAKWRAARALLHETVREVWAEVKAAGAINKEQSIRLRIAGTHAIRESAQVVDIVYNLSGATSIFASQAVQRRFQDAHVITQQVQGREAHYTTVGEYFLSKED
jgi:alkylation response protein AidB-like acyl-CoA dehydrogenase